MRLFKRTYKDRNGNPRTSRKWYLEWRDDQRVCRMPGFLSDRATRELGRNIERLLERRVSHEPLDVPMTRWIESLPNAMRITLVRYGLIDGRRHAASMGLAEHVEDFASALTAKGNTGKYVELTKARVLRIVNGCGFTFWSDVKPGAIESFLADLRAGSAERRGVSVQTSNYHLAAFKSFCRWMVQDRRASESPIAHLRPLKADADRRHTRRALSLAELRTLLQTTHGAPERYGMTGPERAMLYRLAVESGLRANELRSLTRSSFDVKSEEPTVTVQAGYSKRRREDTLPLRPATAEMLREMLATKAPAAPAFSMPKRDRVVVMLRADLSAARAAWFDKAPTPAGREERERSDFLTYRDVAGRVADFHALRHTFISMLAASGVHPKTAQSLARHSTITLTLDRYTHSLREAETAALGALPDLTPSPAAQRATGTDGRQTPGTGSGEPPVSGRAAGRAKAHLDGCSPTLNDSTVASGAATADTSKPRKTREKTAQTRSPGPNAGGGTRTLTTL
jgi:integrase